MFACVCVCVCTKSWAGMYFLVEFLKMKKTVVYESSSQRMFCVFKESGSYGWYAKANPGRCPELKLKTTIHIFDAKAGIDSYEPVSSAAKLILLSSTNINSFKQTARKIGIVPVLFPSTSKTEFFRYASLFGVSEASASEIAAKAGTGKIRVLRQSDPLALLETALNGFDANFLSGLASLADTVNASKIVICCDPDFRILFSLTLVWKA